MADPKIDFQEDIDFQPDAGLDFQEKPSLMQNFLKVAKGAVTPLVSPEQIQQTPVVRQISQGIPIMKMAMGIPRQQPISMQNFLREGSEELSSQTSPLGIATNIGVGMGGLKALGKFPAGMGRGYALKNAEKAFSAIEGQRKALGQAKGAVINQYGDKIVSNFKPNFAQKTIKALKDPLYEIEFTKAGAIKPTVKNLDKVLQALGDIQTGSGWKDATRKIQQQVSKTYGEVADAMRTSYPEIAPSIEKFHAFMDKYKLVRSSVTSKGDVVASKLKGLHEKGFEEQSFKAWESLSKELPELSQVMKNMRKYAGRKGTQDLLKRIAWRALPWAAGGAAFGISNALEE